MLLESLTKNWNIDDGKLSLWASLDRPAFDEKYGEGAWDHLGAILNSQFADQIDQLYPGIWSKAPIDAVSYDGFSLRPEEIQRLEEVRRNREAAVLPQSEYTTLWRRERQESVL